MIKHYTKLLFASALFLMCLSSFSASKTGKPNILWLFVEDASCDISCYGETAIQTPNIDALADEGIKFENAFVTAPVCSPARSAFVTGMYQTTICAHNHRSQRDTITKGGGNENYYESYQLPSDVPLASKLFEEAGYFTSNQSADKNKKGNRGKTDYNFSPQDIYSGKDWKNSPDGTPFYTQIQLHGGKSRGFTAETDDFEIPPYYYDDSIMRDDYRKYLGSWLKTDIKVKEIVADLKEAGVYENTLIFFLTDHGISHIRGKQFLYEDGIKVPLIVKFPDNYKKGSVRTDLVSHIDILPSSLAFAGLPIHEDIQGKNIFAKNYKEQKYVIAARDRCDETIEVIRSVRTSKYKYIRNFISYRPHKQRNQYKDGKLISTHTRELYEQGKLNELQSRFFLPTRPPEELYDLENDPYETINLATNADHKEVVTELRDYLYKWMEESNDPGLIPEPYLEELGKEFGNKTQVLKQDDFKNVSQRAIKVIEAGETKNIDVLLEAAKSDFVTERYWATTWLGVNKVKSAQKKLEALIKDKDPSVRVAANLALYKVNPDFDPIPNLSKEVSHKNLIVGMYAMSAIEQTNIRNKAVKEIALTAMKSNYEFTKRYAKYLRKVCADF